VNIDSGLGLFSSPFGPGIDIHIASESVFTSPRNFYSHAPEFAIADAARLIVDGTHRVCTPVEVQAYRDRQGAERARTRKDDLDRTRETFESVMGVKRA
jgi:hypothetical protein